jgi:RsiW-degrading membrane proteinase PrsW (M82 family)
MLELLLLAIAPSLFVFLSIYRKDCYEPEPLHLLAWIFFLGALSVIAAGLIELPFPEGVISSAFIAPVVEESLKFLVVFLAIYRHPEFDEPMDGIVYATAAGLGFATVENVLYVIDGGIAVGIIRAIASVPGHVVFSCIWGFALGTAKFRPKKERAKIILTGLFGAMLMHGIFNFSLEVFEVLGLILILVVIIPFGWWMTCRNIRNAQADPASACSALGRAAAAGMVRVGQQDSLMIPVSSTGTQVTVQRFCTVCGASLHEGMGFCENCGKKVS